jgi:hypothetical protein
VWIAFGGAFSSFFGRTFCLGLGFRYGLACSFNWNLAMFFMPSAGAVVFLLPSEVICP